MLQSDRNCGILISILSQGLFFSVQCFQALLPSSSLIHALQKYSQIQVAEIEQLNKPVIIKELNRIQNFFCLVEADQEEESVVRNEKRNKSGRNGKDAENAKKEEKRTK